MKPNDKRLRFVGRPVAREEVLLVLGDPQKWKQEAAAFEKRFHRKYPSPTPKGSAARAAKGLGASVPFELLPQGLLAGQPKQLRLSGGPRLSKAKKRKSARPRKKGKTRHPRRKR